MIKGISKQIIEVQDTQSQYYEKAYFVVRPEFSAMEQALLEREARRIVRQAGAPSRFRKTLTKQTVIAAAGTVFLIAGGVLAYGSVSGWFG